ncbi:DUF3060 domain-containing protein [Lysobacter sp. K5869]|uniref:DUF3060 domain-containing protein n=1 Tax=Lysobacter sp. K5869 TaxID=2820808 RepID=UPI001C05F2BB|nr:DUF3060 domain-containing protein [Lysobacter sp. K5869]QWP77104.1 DUF3060 domain-containing protein [Lysobacter sp. K5869]
MKNRIASLSLLLSLGFSGLLHAAPLGAGATGQVEEADGMISIEGTNHERSFVGTGGELHIVGTNNRITVTGPLSLVSVDGAGNTVQVDSVKRVEIVGAQSHVYYKSAPTKTGRPASSVTGAGSGVSKR